MSRLVRVLDLDVQVDGSDRQIWQIGENRVVAERTAGRWKLNGAPMPRVAAHNGTLTVFTDYGQSFDVIDPLDRDASATGDTNVIEAPMPGLVKAVFATAGQTVQKGDRLAILEAMKMEHSLLAARDGIVAEVLVEDGSQVEAGAALVRLEDEA